MKQEHTTIQIPIDVLSEDEIAEIVKEQMKNTLTESIRQAIQWGDIKHAIDKRLKEILVPYIENYNFSDLLPKLDTILTEIVKTDVCKEDKMILENFKELMLPIDAKTITVTELFDAWKKHVAANIDTSDLEVILEEYPHYEDVYVTAVIKELPSPSWSYHQHKIIRFETDQDEDLYVEIPVSNFTQDLNKYRIARTEELIISSLRYLNPFELLLLRLDRNHTDIILDVDELEDYIRPDAEP